MNLLFILYLIIVILSIITFPVALYTFGFTHHNKQQNNLRSALFIACVGFIILLSVLTNPIHPYFKNASYKDFLTYITQLTSPSIYLYPIYCLSYFLFSLTFVFILAALLKGKGSNKKKVWLLLLGTLPPLVTNIYNLFLIEYNTIIYFITPMTFILASILYHYIHFVYSHKNIVKQSRELMIENMSSGSLFIDSANRIFDINAHALKLINLPMNQVIGKQLYELQHPLINSIQQLINSDHKDNILYLHKSSPLNQYFLIQYNSFYDRYVHEKGTLILITDVSQLQHTLNQLEYIGSHDDLTGVYNRYYFQRQLKEFDFPSNYPIAIVVGDVNGLKSVNDKHGHSSGDSLLVESAEKIVNGFKQGSIVCRIGGDEFVILIPNTSYEEIEASIEALEHQVFSYSDEGDNVGISLDYAIKTNENQTLQQLFKEADANMYLKKALIGSSSRDNNIQLLQRILSGKDIETQDHLSRTAKLAIRFAAKIDLDHSQTNDLVLLSQLHDIGKTIIPDQILLKPASLTEAEWTIMKSHTIKGYDILSASPTLKSICDYVLHHHEHYNGKGYPNQLKGDDIPYLSRIISIIDAFDVMTNIRVYKEAMPTSDALIELQRCMGTQFDPDLTKQFIDMIEEEMFI